MTRRFAFFFCALLTWLVSCAETRQPTLEVTASTTTLAAGQSARLTVTRYFPGGPAETVTDRVRFAVTPRDVVSVSAEGVVTAASQSGNATVRISDPQSEASTSVGFVVLGNAIVSLRVDPTPAIALVPGQTRSLTATATFTDGSEQDVTRRVQWSSSNEAAAIVGSTQGNFGVVSALTEGDTTITVADVPSNTQARTLVFVRGAGPTLLAINVVPNPATVGVGRPVPLTAEGIYANGKTADLTKTATWTSSDSTKAIVDANGVATGVAIGDVTITAASVDVKGSIALEVR